LHVRSWWKGWLAHVQPDAEAGEAGEAEPPAPHPGEVQNALLLAKQSDSPDGDLLELRQDLTPDDDFVVLSEASWRYIHAKYGGGPAIRRTKTTKTTVTLDSLEQHNNVSLYPQQLQVRPGGGSPPACAGVAKAGAGAGRAAAGQAGPRKPCRPGGSAPWLRLPAQRAAQLPATAS
jgi:hypothetical protein